MYECSCSNIFQDLSNLRQNACCSGGYAGPLPWSYSRQHDHAEEYWSLVPAYQETLMEAPQLGLRASLDLPGNPAFKIFIVQLELWWGHSSVIFPAVRWNGLCELFGDEGRRQCALPIPLLNPAGTQLGLDPNFFWGSQC